MTTPAVTESTDCRLLTRKERLLVAIWEGWKSGKQYRYRELLERSGMVSTGHLTWMIGCLEEQGILIRDRYQNERGYVLTRSLRPGPRFAGIYRGRPMVVIKDEAEPEPTRITKYERRGTFFDLESAARRLA